MLEVVAEVVSAFFLRLGGWWCFEGCGSQIWLTPKLLNDGRDDFRLRAPRGDRQELPQVGTKVVVVVMEDCESLDAEHWGIWL